MIHPFIGRRQELQILNDLLKKRAASLIVIRGRRRIGKSRLTEEFARQMPHYVFSGLPPTEATTARHQRELFAGRLQQTFHIPLPRADDWSDLFLLLAEQTKKGKVAVVLDEISWMGSKDPTFLGKLKVAWDLHFKKNPQLILILCGSISSWIEKNILSSTGFLGRISLDLTLEELPLHECNAFWNHHRVSAYEKFKILSVTGGVPRYLEEIVPGQSAEENIHNLCFRKGGFLLSEFERIFSDLFSSRSGTYKKIVQRLADGPCELSAIYKALGVKKSGVVGQYLEDLQTSGFISQDFTWHLKNGQESKLSQFRLKDNYLRFYLKYIQPNMKKIERGGIKLPSQWPAIFGLQFENLVLHNRKSIYRLLQIDPADIIYDNPYFQRRTIFSFGCQIDYMIQNRFGTCYVCEIKCLQGKVPASVIDEVKQKMDAIVLPKHVSLRPVLIHINGVEDAVIESDFFSAIIDFGQLLEEEASFASLSG